MCSDYHHFLPTSLTHSPLYQYKVLQASLELFALCVVLKGRLHLIEAILLNRLAEQYYIEVAPYSTQN